MLKSGKVDAYPKGKRRNNKYGAVKTEYDSRLIGFRIYDSKAEAEYVARLDMLWAGKAIRGYIPQVTIHLGPDFKTRVDFLVNDEDGQMEAHEVKGMETPQFKQVRRLWPKYGPCPLIIVKKKGNSFEAETIQGRNS